MTTQDAVLIIGVVTTSIVTIINTIGLFWGKRDIKRRINRANIRLMKAEDSRFNVARNIIGELQDNKKKLENVEVNTNGNLTRALDRMEEIEKTLVKVLATQESKEKDKLIIDSIATGKS